MRLFRLFAVWLVIAAAESVHGTLRTLFLAPLTGDFAARQIAVFTGSAIFVAVAFIFGRWMAVKTFSAQLAAGAFWVVMTLGFEVALGRLVMGVSWERILSDYDLPHGGLMPIGLIIMLFAPAIAANFQAARTTHEHQTVGH